MNGLFLWLLCLLPTAHAEPMPVSVQRLDAQSSYRIEHVISGLAEARQQSRLGFELGGRIEQLFFDEGEQVEAGAALAQLDTLLLQRETESLQAQRIQIRARLDQVDADLARLRRLEPQGYVSTQERDQLRAERLALSAQLQQIEAEQAANATRIEKSTLRAPFAGTITHRLLDTGAVVGAGVAVFEVLETGAMEGRFGFPPHLIPHLALDQPVVLRAQGQKAWQTGQVVALIPRVEARSRTATLRVALESDTDLLPGTLLELKIEEPVSKAGFWVPLEALHASYRGLWQVYIAAGETSQVQARSVRIIHSETDRAYVQGAIEGGEWLIDRGVHRVTPGQHVRGSEETHL